MGLTGGVICVLGVISGLPKPACLQVDSCVSDAAPCNSDCKEYTGINVCVYIYKANGKESGSYYLGLNPNPPLPKLCPPLFFLRFLRGA